MPEYLSPGVYIEEVPPRLRAIEGVSTSTVGFSGVTERGPVPGENLVDALFNAAETPTTDTLPLPLPRDAAPRLVTSYGDFAKIFGNPLPMPDPEHHAYLSRAVKAFFDNGGKRCYISRVIPSLDPATDSATRAQVRLTQGSVLHLVRRVSSGDTDIFLDSLRNVEIGTQNVTFRKRADLSEVLTVDVSSYDIVNNSITVPGTQITRDLNPADIFVVTGDIVDDPNDFEGPVFHARSPGSWGEALQIRVRPSDRGPVQLAAETTVNGHEIQVASTVSFYRGAIIEINNGSEPRYNEVTNILPGNVLRLADAVGSVIAPSSAAGEPPFVRVVEIDVWITDETALRPVTEVFRGLTWNPGPHPETRRRYYAAVLNNKSNLVYVQPPGWDGLSGSEDATPATQPTTANGFDSSGVSTEGGDGGTLTDDDYIGQNTDPETRTGIAALRSIDDIAIIACPGRFDVSVQNALITQCENLRYRFAILDSDPSDLTVTDLLGHRNLYDSSYAAYYCPWVEVKENGEQLFLPPSGFMAGIYARSDNERGVHKAPANEVVRNIADLRSHVTTGEQDILNPRGVNVIRYFEGRGNRVWGARTLSSDPAMRYVSTRRFLSFLEKSIDRGTQWVVFEPNNPDTWSRVVDSVSAFLHTQWRAGALLGRTPEQAYFVRCDESTMTADDIENGRLICEIGIAIVKPAEFVIFRIEQIAAFGETT